MTESLDGHDYRARRRIADAENVTLAEKGATCEHVPPEALPSLLEAGDIERAVERRAATPSEDR
jgi:hypothetical protein